DDDASGPLLPGFAAAAAPGGLRPRTQGGRERPRRHLDPPPRLVPGPAQRLDRRPHAPPYDTAVRAVVLDVDGLPELADIPEPSGAGLLVRVVGCGLCGSDVEKLGRAAGGAVLGHEVAG